MPDPHFYDKAGPYTLRELAELPDIELAENVDPELLISDVKPLDQAGEGDITFLSNPKYAVAFRNTRASACIANRKALNDLPEGLSILIAEDPYKAYARVAAKFYAAAVSDGRIHPTAVIAPTAVIGADVAIGPYAVIEERAEIGEGSVIGPHVVIGDGVRLGCCCRVGAGAVLTYCFIGDHVSIYTGARIGQDGFGFAPDPERHVKIPQLGRVVIGSHVEIGANATIDRGAGPDTRIGDNTWIDNMVQVAHNVVIGKGVIIAAQTGISGSTEIEDYAVIGGQVGLAGHIRVGKGAQISAKSGVISDVPTGQIYAGYPARPRKQFFRQMATLGKLSKKKGSKND